MKKTILALALVAGLTSLARAEVGFTSSSYPFFFEQIKPSFPISDQYGSYYGAVSLFAVYNAQKNDKVTLYTSIPGQLFMYSAEDPGWELYGGIRSGLFSSYLWVQTANTSYAYTSFSQGITGYQSPIEYTYATYTYADGTSTNVYPTSVLSFSFVPPPPPFNTYPVPLPDGTTATITIPELTIPEPSTYALFGIGAIGILMVIRRNKTA
jgi:hypothetical protein